MRASSLGRNMFCSEGIFGVVLFPASEISLLKRASSWGWDRRLTLLIGPCSQYRGFCTSKIFVTCGQLRNQGAARPTGVDIDTAEVSSEVGIFSGQECAYNRKQVFLPVHPPSFISVLHESRSLAAGRCGQVLSQGTEDLTLPCPSACHLRTRPHVADSTARFIWMTS